MKPVPKILLALAASALIGMLPWQSAQGAQIQGDIDFGGVVTLDTTSLATATQVNLWQPFSGGPSNFTFVLKRTGDFANPTFGIDSGDLAAMTGPWVFNSSAGIPALWTIGGFTFDLTSSVIVRQGAQFLNVQGIGTITGNNFDPTPGTWSFTSSISNGSDNGSFSFQAETAAVPEPASVILVSVGLGLIGLRPLVRGQRKTA